jgi:hypothetical protein
MTQKILIRFVVYGVVALLIVGTLAFAWTSNGPTTRNPQQEGNSQEPLNPDHTFQEGSTNPSHVAENESPSNTSSQGGTEPGEEGEPEKETGNLPALPGTSLVILKDVGEPYMDRFGLSPSDFRNIKAQGVDVIAVNFDICASGSDVVTFLDGADSAGLKVIMPAGSGEAEWGYPCDGEFSDTQKPVWQKAKVQAWVTKWAYHPAIYAWDISNEDGQNFPNAQKREDTWIEEGYAVSLKDLQQAYKDVKAADPTRPILARMNGWYFYDYDSNFFQEGNAFGPGVADIVMINAYSNVEEYFDDMVETVAKRAEKAVRGVNPNAKIIIALGAWKEAPMWYLPTVAHFTQDVSAAKTIGNLLGVAIFKYGAEGSEWWMPKDAGALWNELKSI